MTNTTPKRGRGRPKGSRNKASASAVCDKDSGAQVSERAAPSSSSPSAAPAASTRAGLEADRDRLLRGIAECSRAATEDRPAETDWKTVAALQSQLNGVNRMLLRISGESAPSDANLIRSPQWGRLKARLFDCLSKKHPLAWADVLALEADEAG